VGGEAIQFGEGGGGGVESETKDRSGSRENVPEPGRGEFGPRGRRVNQMRQR